MVKVSNVRIAVSVANRWELADEVGSADCSIQTFPWPLDPSITVCDFIYELEVESGAKYPVGRRVRVSHDLPPSDNGQAFVRLGDVRACEGNRLTIVAPWNGPLSKG